MKNNEYIIINKESIQKRIEELEMQKKNLAVDDFDGFNYINSEIKGLRFYTSQSTPLVPELEKAFDAGVKTGDMNIQPDFVKNSYISNLKPNI